MRKRAWLPVAAVVLAAAASAETRVLLVSGSGAEERAAAASLAGALRASGRFAIFTADDPAALNAAALRRYHAVAADCDASWTDAAKRALEAFVRQGGGLAAVRAGDCGALAGAQSGPGGGGGRQALRVRSGDTSYLTVDDPGPTLQPGAGARVVAHFQPAKEGGAEQPAAWEAAYGKGRVWQSRLGRNAAIRQEPEFTGAFVRAVEWAATGAVKPAAPAPETDDARALVVTGGHTYDASFYKLFEDQPGIHATVDPHPMPYRRGDLGKRYDVLVLYDSMQEADERERRNLTNFVESGKGVVILHHALVDYSDWQWWWEEVMGGRWLKVGGPGTRWKTGYKHDVDMLVYPVGEHPVTAGVGPMRITDETYKGMWLAPGNQVLMRTDDPSSDGPVVWISPYRKSRVVVIELGHDRKAHLHPGYQRLVRNAVRWAAGKEPAPAARPAATGFRAGAHSVDITPAQVPIITSGSFLATKAERIDAPLFARALALDDGANRVVMAVVDSLMMPREWLDGIKQEASRRTGIPPARMLISATHTHSAPPVMGALGTDNDPEYAAFAAPRVVEAIEGAVRRLQPAQIGWTAVDVPDQTHNRRWILRPDKMRPDPFGNTTVRAHMHPGYQNAEFTGPSGPVDPELSVLAVRTPQGRPIALFANYSMHYVGAGGRVVSPDYYGFFAENLQRMAGAEGFVAMMSQGTSGDLHWMDYSGPKKDMDARTYAGIMAKIAHDAWQRIEYRDRAPIVMAETKLRLGRRVPDAARMSWAKDLMARMGGAPPRTQPEVYAREATYLAAEPERELILQALRIGDLAIAAIPNEVFALTGLKIKSQSPLRTFNIELANGADGYIPPPAQLALGGYTSWPARTAGLEVNAEPKIAEAVIKLLEQVAGKPRRPAVEPAGPYVKAVMASKPMAYWRGGDFEGPTAKDATGNGRHAAYEGKVAYYLPGAVGTSPYLAGGSLRPGLQPGRSYTVTMWVYNHLEGKALRVAGVEAAVPPGAWRHVALVNSGGKASLYVDGEPASAGAGAPGELAIGEGFEGRIDEVALFPRALKNDEIKRHFDAK